MTEWPDKRIVLLALVLVCVLVLAIVLVRRHFKVKSQYTAAPTKLPTAASFSTSAPLLQPAQPLAVPPTMPQALSGADTVHKVMPASIDISTPSVEPQSAASTAAPVGNTYVMSDNDFQEYLAAWSSVKAGGGDAYSKQWAKHVLTILKDAQLSSAQQAALKPDDQVSITAKVLTLN